MSETSPGVLVAQVIGRVAQLQIVDVSNQRDVANVLSMQDKHDLSALVHNFPEAEYDSIVAQWRVGREAQRATQTRRK